MKYNVSFTMKAYTTIPVDAESPKTALDLARKKLYKMDPSMFSIEGEESYNIDEIHRPSSPSLDKSAVGGPISFTSESTNIPAECDRREEHTARHSMMMPNCSGEIAEDEKDDLDEIVDMEEIDRAAECDGECECDCESGPMTEEMSAQGGRLV